MKLEQEALPDDTTEAPAVWNFEAEESIVGGILVHAAKFHDVKDIVATNDFHHPGTRAIYEAMCRLDADDDPIDAVTVVERLQSLGTLGQLNAFGGRNYPTELMAKVVTVENLAYHAKLVRDKAVSRRCDALLESARRKLIATDDVGTVLHRVASDLDQLQTRMRPGQDASPPIVLETAADIIRGVAFSRPRRKFPTGIPELDAATQGGLRSRQQSVIAAPTGVGKTGLVGTIMLGMSAHHPVLWVCTELDGEEQAARFAALKMRESDRGRYTPDDLLSHAIPPGETAAFIDGMPLHILRLRRIDRDGRIIDPFPLIVAHVNAIASKHGEPPIIVVDYLQKLAAEDEERRRISVGNVSERLLSIAQDFDTHLMAISSVSRAFYNATARKLRKMATEEDPRDWMACGKEAGEIEYDAALMMFLDVGDDADAVAQHRARLIVAKARGGGVGFYGMRFHGPSGLFVPDSKAADEMKAEPRTNTVDLDKIKTEIRKRFMRPRKNPFTSKNGICEIIGGNRNDVLHAIAEMFESEELTQDGKGRPILYSPLSQDDDE